MVSRKGLLRYGAASAAILAVLGIGHVVVAQQSERTISLYNIHTKETITVVYKKGGKYVEAGLERVSHALRDWRRNETTKMDPELVDLLWEMHEELGSKEPIHIISGYRSRSTNDMLRKTSGGQASESRHILGKAADVHFPDVPIKKLRYSAMVRERGGVGYYPTSAIPFVHVDTDRVRAWPRMPRYELALLFPAGVTKHAAADGGAITKDDVRVAQSKYGELATQIASFHDERKTGPKGTLVAANEPAAKPELKPEQVAALPKAAEPRLVDAPREVASLRQPAITSPTAGERAKLLELVSLASADPTPRLLIGPTPARRPQAAALPSLSGESLPGPVSAPVAARAAPKVAAIDPASAGASAPLSDLARGGFAGATWTPAPAYDDEHPEELSYRPFPIAPLLTTTATEPLMSELVHHDVARTVDFIGEPSAGMTLRFRLGEQAAQLLWSQQFTGEAVGINKLRDAKTGNAAGLQSRAVKTTQK